MTTTDFASLFRGPGFGLGCQRLSAPDVSSERAVAVVHAALEAGVRFFDTADVYAPDHDQIGHNESLVAGAVRSWCERKAIDSSTVLIATKGGLVRGPGRWQPDGRARSVRSAAEASQERLQVERIALYQLHAPDPRVKLETSVRALRALQRSGVVERVGVCNVRKAELERALSCTELDSVQLALNPFDLSALKNGVARLALESELLLIAHSPFGGIKKRRALERGCFGAVGRRHGASAQQVVLAWLRSLHSSILPIPGITQVEHVADCLASASLQLTEDDHAEIASELPTAVTFMHDPKRTPVANSKKEVVILMGYPAAGKTTRGLELEQQGYERLNRDERGGTLKALLPELERRLGADDCRVVLDNTYGTREARYDVVDLAARHQARVRCQWLQTSLEQAQVHACQRMLERYGRLLDPDEMKRLSKGDPGAFPPGAQFRYRSCFEEPESSEGFVVETLEPPKLDIAAGERSGLIFDFEDVASEDPTAASRRRAFIQERAQRFDQLISISYQPDLGAGSTSERELDSRLDQARALLGRNFASFHCPHPPGPPICWCRKPLPGLGLLVIRDHGLDPNKTTIVTRSAADRGFAARLGFRVVPLPE